MICENDLIQLWYSVGCVLDALSESELNHITERTSIGIYALTNTLIVVPSLRFSTT